MQKHVWLRAGHWVKRVCHAKLLNLLVFYTEHHHNHVGETFRVIFCAKTNKDATWGEYNLC